MLGDEATDFGGEFESMAAEPDRDEETLGPDPIQDRVRVGRHIIRACPSASRLGLRHPWEAFREPRPDVPGGGGG